MANGTQFINPYADEVSRETEVIAGDEVVTEEESQEFINPYAVEEVTPTEETALPGEEPAFSADIPDDFDPLAPTYDLPTPAAPEEEGTEWKDYAKMTMAGGAQLVKGSGWLLKTLGAEDVGGFLEELGKSSSAYWLEGAEGEWGSEGLSKAARRELAKEFVKETDDGYEMGDASWTTVGLLASNSILGTMAGLGIGGLATKGIQTAGGLAGRTKLVALANSGDKVARAKLAKLVAVEGAVGYGMGEALVSAPSAGSDVYDIIMDMPDKKIKEHPEYIRLNQLIPDDISEKERHATIKNILATAASRKAALGTGMTTFALSSPMGAIIGRYTQGIPLASTRPRAIATGGFGEMTQEFLQSGAEAINKNVAVKEYGDVDQPLFKGVLNEAVGGAAAGLPMGAAFGIGTPLEQPTGRKPAKGTISAEELGDIPDDAPPTDKPEEAGLYEGGIDYEAGLKPRKKEEPAESFQQNEEGIDYEKPEAVGGLGLVELGAEQAGLVEPEGGIEYNKVDLLDTGLTAETTGQADKRVAQDKRIAEQEEKLKGIKLPEGLDDNRLKRLEFRDRAKNALEEMVEGRIKPIPDPDFVPGESDKPGDVPLIYPKSQNPKWVQGLLEQTGMSVAEVKKAVNKALKGEKLGVRQGAAVQGVLDYVTDQRTGDEYGNLDYAKQELEKARQLRDTYTQGAFEEPTQDWLYSELDYSDELDASGRIVFELLNETRKYGEEVEDKAIIIAERKIPDEVVITQLSQLLREYNGYDEQEYQQFAEQEGVETIPGQQEAGYQPDIAQPGTGADELAARGDAGLAEPAEIDEGFAPEPIQEEVTELPDIDNIVDEALAEKEEFVKPDTAGLPEAAVKKDAGRRKDAERADRQGKGDRRTHKVARDLYAEMSREELLDALLTHELTGIKGRRSFVIEVENADNVISIDADSLKWFNDNMSPDSGDKLLQSIADTLVEEVGKEAIYHISGDEFYALDTGQGIEVLEDAINAAQERLKDAVIHVTKEDGTKITKTGVEFTYGIGETKKKADNELKREKKSREEQGLRAGREETPAGVVVEPAEKQPDNEGKRTAEEITKKKPKGVPEAALKKTEKEPVGTAPEHEGDPDFDPRSLDEVVEAFGKAADSSYIYDDNGKKIDQMHHLFDAPKKKEVMRLGKKAEVRAEDEPVFDSAGKPVINKKTGKQKNERVYYRDKGWMTVEEAKKTIQEWKDHAQEQYDNQDQRSINQNKIVLSLFDLTGKWSQPWEDAGYQVYRFDIQDGWDMIEVNGEIINPGDITKMSIDYFNDLFGSFDGLDIHAILAACPCTDFAGSGNKHFKAKDLDGRTKLSVGLVHQTLAVVEHFKPAVWAIENPVGRIERLGGLPPWRLTFEPFHLGENYTKKTNIWGRFNPDLPVAPTEPTEGSIMHKKYGGKSMATKNARSATPEGFAYSFFMANNVVDHPAMTIANKYDRLDAKLINEAVELGVTEKEIDNAVEDFYYMEHDDDGANEAIQELIADKKELKVQLGESNTKKIKSGMTIRLQGKEYPIQSFEEASKKYNKVIQESGAGSRDLEEDPVIYKNGKAIAHISYNGNVWNGHPKEEGAGEKLLYGKTFAQKVQEQREQEEAEEKAKGLPAAALKQKPETATTPEEQESLESRLKGAIKTDKAFLELSRLSNDDIRGMKLPELRDTASKIGFLKSGKKADLIEKIINWKDEHFLNKLKNIPGGIELTLEWRNTPDGSFPIVMTDKEMTVPPTLSTEAHKIDTPIKLLESLSRYNNGSVYKKSKGMTSKGFEFKNLQGAKNFIQYVTGKTPVLDEDGNSTVIRFEDEVKPEVGYVTGDKVQITNKHSDYFGLTGVVIGKEYDAYYDAEFNVVAVEIPEDKGGFTEEEEFTDSELGTAPTEEKPEKTYGKKNKVFTEDAAEKARAIIKKKLGQLNSGIDPELMSAGITLAGYHIESGARKFGDFSKAMINDLGDVVKPYLRTWYEGVRYWPEFDNAEMSTASEIDAELTPAEPTVNELMDRMETVAEGYVALDDVKEANRIRKIKGMLPARTNPLQEVEAQERVLELVKKQKTIKETGKADEPIEPDLYDMAKFKDWMGEYYADLPVEYHQPIIDHVNKGIEKLAGMGLSLEDVRPSNIKATKIKENATRALALGERISKKAFRVNRDYKDADLPAQISSERELRDLIGMPEYGDVTPEQLEIGNRQLARKRKAKEDKARAAAEKKRLEVEKTKGFDLFAEPAEEAPKGTPLNEIKVSIKAQVEETGEFVDIIRPADVELQELDARLNDLKQLRDCIS